MCVYTYAYLSVYKYISTCVYTHIQILFFVVMCVSVCVRACVYAFANLQVVINALMTVVYASHEVCLYTIYIYI